MRVDDEPVYRCRLCLDQGLVLVLHTATMKEFANDPDYEGLMHSCGVRCNCQRGAGWVSAGVFFDATRMVPCAYRPTEDDRAAGRSFAFKRHAGSEWTGQGQVYAGAADDFS